MSNQLTDPRLRKVYRPEVILGEPLDLGELAQGHRRIVPRPVGRSPVLSSTARYSRAPARTGRFS